MHALLHKILSWFFFELSTLWFFFTLTAANAKYFIVCNNNYIAIYIHIIYVVIFNVVLIRRTFLKTLYFSCQVIWFISQLFYFHVDIDIYTPNRVNLSVLNEILILPTDG